MAMQYQRGSVGVHLPSGLELVIVRDTCSESEKTYVRMLLPHPSTPEQQATFPTPPVVMVNLSDIKFTHPITEDFQGT